MVIFWSTIKKPCTGQGFYQESKDYFLAGAGAAGAAAGAAGLAASFFGSSFLAGAVCATADNANADATIANNAFISISFRKFNKWLENPAIYIFNALAVIWVDFSGKIADYLITKFSASASL
jgi:hypothetical protein